MSELMKKIKKLQREADIVEIHIEVEEKKVDTNLSQLKDKETKEFTITCN